MKKRESRREITVSLFNNNEFRFFLFLFLRPKKRFYGKDCRSLAVTIGAGMNLHPILPHSTGRNSILPHSTRRNYKLGLLSLTKYNLGLVMDFLDPQAILPSSRANKSFVAPTCPSSPPNKMFFFSCSYKNCLRFSVVGPSPLLVLLTLSSSPFVDKGFRDNVAKDFHNGFRDNGFSSWDNAFPIWLNSRQKRLISPIFEGPKNNATDNLRLM